MREEENMMGGMKENMIKNTKGIVEREEGEMVLSKREGTMEDHPSIILRNITDSITFILIMIPSQKSEPSQLKTVKLRLENLHI